MKTYLVGCPKLRCPRKRVFDMAICLYDQHDAIEQAFEAAYAEEEWS
jgi:hypothetical protein